MSRKGDRDGESFISPEEQRRSIQAWADANAVRIAKWHVDISRSGGTMARRGLRAAIARIEAGKTGGIVVARLDRFARTMSGGMAAIERISSVGGRVVSVAEHVDPATAIGRMLLGILLVIAQWGRETAKEGFEVAVRNAADRGLFAVRPSYGYMKGEDRRIVKDPTTAPIRLRIIRERADRRSWQAIAEGLMREGIPTPTGGRVWSRPTLANLVESEAALGTYNGPWDLRVENAWEPIVSRELWERANAIRGTRDDARSHQDRAYAGIVRCGVCRRAMQRITNGRGYVNYGCQVPGCVGTTISAPRLDEYLDGLVNARLARWRLRAERDDDGTAARLADQHRAAVAEFETWRDDTDMRAAIGDADYRAGLMTRARRRDDLADQLATIRADQRAESALPVTGTIAIEHLPWEDRRALAEAALHAVWVRKATSRGWHARTEIASRLMVQFMDDAAPEQLHRRGLDLAPIPWAAAA